MLQYYSVMQLWCDFSWQYNLFTTPKIAKNTPLKSKKLVKLTKNLEYRGYLLTFGVEIKRKSASFKTKTNGQTLPKQPQNNFEKVQKTTFSTPKIANNDSLTGQKWVIFCLKISNFEVYYRSLEMK